MGSPFGVVGVMWRARIDESHWMESAVLERLPSRVTVKRSC